MSAAALAGWLAGELGGVAVGAGLTRLKEVFTGPELERPMWAAVKGAVDEAAPLVEVHEGIDRVALRDSLISRLEAPLDRVPAPKNRSFTEIVRAGFAAQILPPDGEPPGPESWTELYGLDPNDLVARLTHATCRNLRGLDAASLSGLADELRLDEVMRAIALTRDELLAAFAALQVESAPPPPDLPVREVVTLRLGPDNRPIGGVAAVGEMIDAYDVARLDGEGVDLRIDDQYLVDVDRAVERIAIELRAEPDEAKAEQADNLRQSAKTQRLRRNEFHRTVQLLLAAPHDGLFTLGGASVLPVHSQPGQTSARAEGIVEAAALTWSFASRSDRHPWYLFREADLGTRRFAPLGLTADRIEELRSLRLHSRWGGAQWDQWAYPIALLASFRSRWFQTEVVPAIATCLSSWDDAAEDVAALTAIETWLFAANAPGQRLRGVAT